MSDILCVKGSVFLRKIVPKFYQKLFSKPSKILSQNAVQLGVIVYRIPPKKKVSELSTKCGLKHHNFFSKNVF